MARRIFNLLLAFIIVAFISVGLNRRSSIAPATVSAEQSLAPVTIQDGDFFLYLPTDAIYYQPVQVLVVIHGMSGNGPDFAKPLIEGAERNHWLLVAPTFRYQDYKQPDLVAQDDLTNIPRLRNELDRLTEVTGLSTRAKALLYGHSRGGQTAHRFATYYPERTLAVTALCSGSYTLPLETMLVGGASRSLPLPYGVANLSQRLGTPFNYAAFKQVQFRVVVGGLDINASDVPRAWDPYIGTNRVERARTYTKVLQDIGVPAELAYYPDAGHGVSEQMRRESIAYLEGAVARSGPRFGFGQTIGAASFGAIIAATQQRH